jgi:hypothetical protein
MDHEITYELVEVPANGGIVDQKQALNLICSCGFTKPGTREMGAGDNKRVYVNWPHSPTKTGKPRRALLRAAQLHIEQETTTDNGKDAPMEFVGKIIRPRVTHEVWIASRRGELPDITGRKWIVDSTYAPHKPWLVLVKNSSRWSFQKGPFAERDMAWTFARDYLNREGIEYDVEMAEEADLSTIQIPLGSITHYFEELTSRVKQAQGTQALLELDEELQEVQNAVDLLGEARKHVLRKLYPS